MNRNENAGSRASRAATTTVARFGLLLTSAWMIFGATGCGESAYNWTTIINWLCQSDPRWCGPWTGLI